MVETLLDVRNLSLEFATEQGTYKALENLSFSVRYGEILGIVGESGCGKSVTSLSILRLIPSPPGKIVGGEIFFEGRDVLKESYVAMRALRGNKISMIFQEPMTSLNPLFTCGNQVMEAYRLHRKVSKKEAREKAIAMLELVGIPLPEKRVDEYPHQLSGGMRQRVMIAIAMACDPLLLIADEPTTALDVSIQAQILQLMKDLREKTRTAVMLITHDLGVIAETADRVVVMYAGQIVEEASVKELFDTPKHPYTEGLLRCIPRADRTSEELIPIPGTVPSLNAMPEGCRFAPRCPFRRDVCDVLPPELRVFSGESKVRCHRHNAAVWNGGAQA